MTKRHSAPIAIFRLAGLVSWTLALLLPCLIGHLLTARVPKEIVCLWHRGACFILGIDIEMSGEPLAKTSVLFVANHISYLDILVLGALLNAGFIAKSEVGEWPVIGFLARLTRTIFVDRSKRSSSGRQRDAVVACLRTGKNLVLFAEGTSSDGSQVLPFKSTLFSAVEPHCKAHRSAIQPITLAYGSRRNTSSIDQNLAASYAWYGDMELVPHLWQVLGLPGVRVDVLLHDAVCTAETTNRKELAVATKRIVADGLVQLRTL